MMSFVRTVLGDIDPNQLGVTYSHEHLVIDGGRPVLMVPEFDLGDVDAMAAELGDAAALGLRSVVDCMPCDAGRNVEKLAELSRRTGIHVVAPTGLHHERYYGPAHWNHRLSVGELGDLFAADITDGIDTYDYSGPLVRRTPYRAGVIKVAGSEGGPSDRDRRVFEAAAEAHGRTGAPILTHCEHGAGALEQLRLLADQGVALEHVALSHVDKVVDRGYHRELLSSGAFAEYDQSFRWRDGPNGTLQLIDWMAEDGLDDRIVLGMDAARRGYYRAFGGAPGLTWLLDGFRGMLETAGIDGAVLERMLVANPAKLFAFGTRAQEEDDGRALDHDARHRADRRLLHEHAAQPART